MCACKCVNIDAAASVVARTDTFGNPVACCAAMDDFICACGHTLLPISTVFRQHLVEARCLTVAQKHEHLQADGHMQTLTCRHCRDKSEMCTPPLAMTWGVRVSYACCIQLCALTQVCKKECRERKHMMCSGRCLCLRGT